MARGFSPAAVRAFELFLRPWMRRHLRGPRIAGLPGRVPLRAPLLLVANHSSWWDPFLLREVQRRLRPTAPLYSVMLQRELACRPFFRRLGAIDIDPQRPTSVAGAVRELQRRVRERPDASIMFFPQGRIWPSQRRPLGFQPGIGLLLRHLRPILVLPIAIHLEPLAAPAPTAFVLACRLFEPDEAEQLDAVRLEQEVAAGLDRIHAFLAVWGEDAVRGWPSPNGGLPTWPPHTAPTPRSREAPS
jgi:1-acyl-sn-glycerol-3-phosphate acyltransferase